MDKTLLKNLALLPVIAESGPWTLDALDDVLCQAHRRCGDDAKASNETGIWTYLSGGLESSLSLAILAKLFDRRDITAVTINWPDSHDKIAIAKAIAERFGVAQVILDQTQNDLDCAVMVMMTEDHLSSYDLLLYRDLSRRGVSRIIVQDGIHELMGSCLKRGFRGRSPEDKREIVEVDWHRLFYRVSAIERVSKTFGKTTPLLPFLDAAVIKFISRIPLDDRTDSHESKKPLRALGRRYGLPETILMPHEHDF